MADTPHARSLMDHYPPAIFAIGRNYAEHDAEMRAACDAGSLSRSSGSAGAMGGSGRHATADRPIVFMKNPASVIGDGEPIVIPAVCDEPDGSDQVDYEGELAVIIGERCRDVPRDCALEVVGGYAAANDVSARWWQKHGSGGQFVRGKSFDTFCPMSMPTPASAVADPQALELVTTLNGAIVQQANTRAMIYSVAALIAELSRGMTLLPGTMILTGTPSGVGFARTPPRLLRDGDEVVVSIAGVGTVRNPVTRANLSIHAAGQ